MKVLSVYYKKRKIASKVCTLYYRALDILYCVCGVFVCVCVYISGVVQGICKESCSTSAPAKGYKSIRYIHMCVVYTTAVNSTLTIERDFVCNVLQLKKMWRNC